MKYSNRDYLKIWNKVQQHSFWFQHKLDIFKVILKLYPPKGDLLDIGAGNGFIAKKLQKIGYRVFCYEPDKYFQKFLGKTVGQYRVVNNFPESKNKYQAAYFLDTLEHIKDDLKMLKQIAKILHKGDRIYISVPAYKFLWSYHDVNFGHYRRYTLAALKNMLKKANLEYEYGTYYFFVLPLIIFFVRKILGKFINKKKIVYSSHSIKNKFVKILLDFMFSIERYLVKRNISIPFGASIFLVIKVN